MTLAADPFVDAHADMLSALGGNVATAVVTRGSVDSDPLQVVVHDGVARVGEYGQVVGRNTRVDFLRSAFQPVRGDLVSLNGGPLRKVDAIEVDDGFVVQVVLHG
ncbi:MAG TPA: hypothetical protein VN624_02210 [Rhodanobacter sp.]|nr:hypothetical protein [Rhodanobacter sp.]